MMNSARLSAYISIFDDWDILPEALSSIDPLVDEIVIIDGAYDWLVPFLGGRDGKRSRDEVYDCLAPYSNKIKVINQTWTDEFQKRRMGYELCSGRYVLRHDADEIFFPDHDNIDRFFKSDKAVGQTNIPIFLTPEYIRSNESGDAQYLGVLFDKSRISDVSHLSYLWLVLPDNLKQPRLNHSLIYPSPIGFTAHLTSWRTPDTSINRALFYVMLYVRNGGIFSVSEAAAQTNPDFVQALLGHAIVGGPLSIPNSAVSPSPLGDEHSPLLSRLYGQYLSGLARYNRDLANGRAALNGNSYAIDITTAESASAISGMFEFSEPLMRCSATVTTLSSTAPFVSTADIDTQIDGNRVSLVMPKQGDDLQKTLTLFPYCSANQFVKIRTLA